MSDIAKLGITIDASGAITQVNTLGASLDNLAAKEKTFIATKAQSDAAWKKSQGIVSDFYAEIGRMKTAWEAANQTATQSAVQSANLAVSQEKAATAAGAHGLQLGRLRMELGTLVGQLTGTSTAVDRMAGALGGMAVGDVIVIGALAGIAAIGLAYEALTKSAHDAAEAQKKTADEYARIAHLSVAGQGEAATRLYGGDPFSADPLEIQSVPALRKQVADLQKRIADGTTIGVGRGGATFNRVSTDAVEATEQVKKLNAELTRRNDLLLSVTGPGGTISRAGKIQAGEDLPGFTTDQLKEQADALKERLRIEKLIEDQERRNIEAAQKAIAQTNDRIAQLKVEIDADQRMAVAKTQGQDAVDALTVALAGEAAARDSAGKAMPARIAELVALTKAHAENAIAARKNAEAEKQLADDIQQAAKDVVDKINADQAAADKQAKYVQQMRNEWIRGIDGIVAHGLSSFSNFFESVQRMFQQMLATMEQNAKSSAIGKQLLGFGLAAIGGGLAGYGIGQQTGSTVGGLFGGAASGALAGSAFGIPGAVIGGLAGAAGGLLGASKAQKESAEQLRLAALALQAQAGAFIAASHSGNPVVDALGANDASVAGLLKAGGFAPSAGRTARPKYTGADIEAAGERNAQRIADDFWAGITQSLNALNGPLGEYQNGLDAIEAQYRQNIESAKALHATDKQLADIEAVRVGQEKALAKALEDKKKAEEEVARASIVSSAARLLQAQGQTWAAEQIRMQESQKTEMDALIKSMGDTIDPLAVAALSAAQAAETAAAAWQHTQDVINQGTDWINQQAGVFGTSQADVFAQETANFGFGGMTPEQVKALYTIWSAGAEITPDQKALNDHISRWLNDYNALHPVDQLIAGTTGPSKNYGANSAMTAVQSTVTERTAYQLVDINRSQLAVLRNIERNTERLNGGRSFSDIDSYLGNKTKSSTLFGGSVKE